MTQPELAQAVGISRETLQRLESGREEQPNLRYLVNCALVLHCDLDELIEDPWREWYVFDIRASAPPEAS